MELRERQSLATLLRRLGDLHIFRSILALLLAQAATMLAAQPARLGTVASFAVACLCAGLAIGLIASLADDDLRMSRLVGRLRGLARHAPSSASETKGGGLQALEGEVEEVGALMASIEQRLLHRHPVSGLPTREPLFGAIADALGRGEAGVLGVIHLLDLDRLHAFDETLAESLLVTLSGRIVEMLGGGRMVAQVDRARLAVWYGADVPADAASSQIQAIGYALGGAIEIEGRELLPNVRVSIASAPQDGDAPATLLARASLVRPAEPAAAPTTSEVDPLMAAQERYALEQDLRRAITRAELDLAYQPLVDTHVGGVFGAEALLRWRHPVRGLIPPTRFVPIMEAAGLADEIGLWAINAACREAKSWEREGLGRLRVAVNISGHQLDRGDLVTLIERTLARHSLGSDMLGIELTETIAAGDTDRVSALFRQLRALGVTIAIDDFGTGYSSFSTLRTLRFDKIKIDREFVTAVDRRRDSQAICRSILALGQGLGTRVLAEGVETVEEYRWLRAQGCRHFQGYYFSKPLEGGAFQAYVRDTGRLAELLDPVPIAFASPERLRA